MKGRPSVRVQQRVVMWACLMQEEGRGLCGSGPTLTSWVQQQQRRHVGKLLSLAVVELENHFR